MSQTITLTRGYVTIVNDADYEELSKHEWYAKVSPSTVYAARSVRINGVWKTVRMHREIVGAKPGEEVDHINHNGLDNRRENLRICSRFQNQGNQRRRQEASSQYKGVHWKKAAGRWRAQISHNGSRRHLGYFTDEVEAAKAYDEAALSQWGEYAKTNFTLVEEA
jgi:hypothetical protein